MVQFILGVLQFGSGIGDLGFRIGLLVQIFRQTIGVFRFAVQELLIGVLQFQPSVLQYTDQIRALFLQIVYGFAQRRFWRSVGCFCPCQQSVHHGLGPFQMLRISFFGWQFC